MMKEAIHLLPTVTVVLAVFKLMFCDGPNDLFCIPWTILFLPVTLYGIYFLYGMIKVVRSAVNSADKDDIDISF